MRGRVALRRLRLKRSNSALLCLFFLSICFLSGAFAGHSYSAVCDPAAQSSLTDYLRDYCVLLDTGRVNISVWRCAVLYLGYSAAAFLVSFSPLGVILIPLLAGTLGFVTMYTTSCFVLAFGRSGIIPAVALLIIRLCFTLPCFFLLCEAAWPRSAKLALLSIGRGGRCEQFVYESRYFILFFLCVLILIVGMCCEFFLTPRLFRAAVHGLG